MTREEAIEKLQKQKAEYLEEWVDYSGVVEAYDMAIEALQNRPQGEWKPKNHHTDYCSSCGFEETQWHTADYNFCPNCGADMRGDTDD